MHLCAEAVYINVLPRVVHCASNRCPAMYRLCEPMGLIGLDASVKVQLLAELPQGRFDRATSVLIGKGCLWRRIEITGTWCSKPTWRRHGGKYPRAGSRWFQCAGLWVRAHYRDATRVYVLLLALVCASVAEHRHVLTAASATRLGPL